MDKTIWKGGALLAPTPVCLVSCAHGGVSNMLTVAWAGTVCTKPPVTYISVRPTRFSHALIKDEGSFVINLTSKPLVRAADWCGMKSGRDFDKFAELGLETEPSPLLGLPMLCASPVSIECRVREITPLGSHDMFLADVVGVCVASDLIDAQGALRLDKANLCAFAHGEYFNLGQKLGGFGFSVKKKKAARRKQR
ncbi:MAG: flavin reductase family protein [Oscillospiraceae bacterium]